MVPGGPLFVNQSTVTVAVGVGLAVTVKIACVVPLFPSVTLTSLTASVVAPACRQFENSEVLPAGSVAVAVTRVRTEGTVTLKLALPAPSVVTVVDVRNVRPSPLPFALHVALSKNSMVNVVAGLLFSVPEITVVPLVISAEEITGKF